MFEFACPAAFFLLVPWGLLVAWLFLRKKDPAVKVSCAAPFRIAARGKAALPWRKWTLPLVALLLVAALARPRFGDEKIILRSRGIDMILAIDLSGSMAALDVPENVGTPDKLRSLLSSGALRNRLETAKEELKRFVQGRPNDRLGLIGFGPMACSMVPPTLDHAWLLTQLDRMTPGMLGDQTDIAAPIASGILRLKGSKAPRRVLVLFTDGKNTRENRLTPEQTAELGQDSDVSIYTVGIGGGKAFYPGKDLFGRTVLQPIADDFDEALLQTLASKSGGRYFRAADADGLQKAMDEINRLEKTSFEQPKYVEYREQGPLLVSLALLLLVAGWLACNVWKPRLP